MSLSRYVIASLAPIRDGVGRNVHLLEICAYAKPKETCEDFKSRFVSETRQAPKKAPAASPVAPVIPELLPQRHSLLPAYSPELAAKACEISPNWKELWQARWPNLTAAEALAGLFTPDQFVALSSPRGDVCEPLKKLANALESYERIIANPVLGLWHRAPLRRQNIIVAFPDRDLSAQLDKALYLNRLLPLALSVFVPSRLACENWFKVGNAASAALSRFAREAIQLGADARNLNPRWEARVPGSLDRGATPRSRQQLAEIGISYGDNRCLVLFHQKADIRPGRKKMLPNESKVWPNESKTPNESKVRPNESKEAGV